MIDQKLILDIDECITMNPCHPNATCINGIGTYTCKCNAGYLGNGSTCQGRLL